MRSLERLMMVAILSISVVAASIGVSHAHDEVVRVGYQKYGNLILVKGKGTLEQKLTPLGFKVEWKEFPSGPPLLEALNDIGATEFLGVRSFFTSRMSRQRRRVRRSWCRRRHRSRKLRTSKARR